MWLRLPRRVWTCEGFQVLRKKGKMFGRTGFQRLVPGFGDAVLDWRLRRAVRRGDASAVSSLVARGARVESRDAYGLTCLMIAANRGDLATMTSLLAAGADPTAPATVRYPGRWSGFTPLMAACCDSTGAVAPVTLLLKSGADPHAEDDVGRNALDYAELHGYREIMAHLRAEGLGRGSHARPAPPRPDDRGP